jgi:hypothetical protein
VACRFITVLGFAAGAGARVGDLIAIVGVGFACLGLVFLYGARH